MKVALLAGLLLVATHAHAGASEGRFWSWFIAQQDRLYRFEQNREAIFDELGGVRVKGSGVRFSLLSDAGKVGILLYLPGYSESESETFGQIAFLLLDESLGEYDVETGLGVLELGPLSRAPAESHPLAELPKLFDERRTSSR